jgi:hypothetical protein
MLNLRKYKKYFLYTMIASLIFGALVGIVSILIGSFSETSGRVIASLVAIVIHSLASFYVIADDDNDVRIQRLKLFYETLFVLIVFSLVTSLLATWGALDEEITSKLFGSYASVGLAALILSLLQLFSNKSRNITAALMSAAGSTAAMLAMVLLLIFAGGDALGDFFYRLLAVVGIVMGTSIVVTTVLYKLYLQSHPEEENVLKDGRGGRYGILRVLGVIVATYILINIAFGLFFLASF